MVFTAISQLLTTLTGNRYIPWDHLNCKPLTYKSWTIWGLVNPINKFSGSYATVGICTAVIGEPGGTWHWDFHWIQDYTGSSAASRFPPLRPFCPPWLLQEGFGLSSSPVLHGLRRWALMWSRSKRVVADEVCALNRWYSREPSMWQPRSQGWSMLFATQPLYDELRHAISMHFTLGSPLHILNMHYTKSIKGSIILEQKWMYFVH